MRPPALNGPGSGPARPIQDASNLAAKIDRQHQRHDRETELGGDLTAGQKLAISRAAVLVALAEDARVRKLNGAVDITWDDLVRLDRLSTQSVRALGISAAPAKPRAPSLAEIIAEHEGAE